MEEWLHPELDYPSILNIPFSLVVVHEAVIQNKVLYVNFI